MKKKIVLEVSLKSNSTSHAKMDRPQQRVKQNIQESSLE